MQEWAAREECRFEEAAEDELFIDIDNETSMTTFNSNWDLVTRMFPFYIGWRRKARVTITPSKSGLPRRHIRVKLLRQCPLKLRIFMQACLGSDLKREVISWKRAEDGEKNVVVFFEKEATA